MCKLKFILSFTRMFMKYNHLLKKIYIEAFKYIRIWNPYTGTCTRYSIFFSILGLFGVPKDLCGEMYALAVDDFLKEKPLFLEEIHFVDLDISMLALVKEGFKNLQSGALRTPVEQRHPDVVWIDVPLNQHSSMRDTDYQDRHDRPDLQQFLQTYKIHERLHVHIYSCDILKAETDGIVNAANEHLSHVGGVAKSIAEKAGRQLTDASNEIAARKKLDVTDVVQTTAGRLPHRAVLHAIGPRWKYFRDKKECLEALKDTIKNILYKAEEMRLRSVAIPSISAGTILHIYLLSLRARCVLSG